MLWNVDGTTTHEGLKLVVYDYRESENGDERWGCTVSRISDGEQLYAHKGWDCYSGARGRAEALARRAVQRGIDTCKALAA